MKILVMGLPGSGKTYLTERLVPLLNAAWYNADKVREWQMIGIFLMRVEIDNQCA